jgi:hypothetical protein
MLDVRSLRVGWVGRADRAPGVRGVPEVVVCFGACGYEAEVAGARERKVDCEEDIAAALRRFGLVVSWGFACEEDCAKKRPRTDGAQIREALVVRLLV